MSSSNHSRNHSHDPLKGTSRNDSAKSNNTGNATKNTPLTLNDFLEQVIIIHAFIKLNYIMLMTL